MALRHSSDIFEDMLTGIFTRLPHATAAGQTLDIALPSTEYLSSTHASWVKIVTSLRDVAEIYADGKAARQILMSMKMRRTQGADAAFPRLRLFKTAARRAPSGDVQTLHQLLRDEENERGPDCVMPLEDIRVN